MFFLEHIWIIPLLPAFGAAMMFFFGRPLSGIKPRPRPVGGHDDHGHDSHDTHATPESHDAHAAHDAHGAADAHGGHGGHGIHEIHTWVNVICVGAVVLAFLFAVGAVWQFVHSGLTQYEKVIYTWLGDDSGKMVFTTLAGHAAEFKAEAGFLLDPLSSIWLLFVTGVGMLIHIYSVGYMAHDGGYYRFFGYLNLFMFSMLTLVLANNYVMMFVGWEGVGLCSYLLIGFYFLKHSASTAANKAFIVNRVGDAGVILGMFTVMWMFGTVKFTAVTEMARSQAAQITADPMLSGLITAACLLLFLGACGKSAQLPLYVWLPDAMEGPTPVSALIHAATMVTAGVYMVARSNALFVLAPDGHAGRGHCGRADGHLCRLDRPGAERHQARAGLLHGFAVGIHVPGARRRSLYRRRVPRLHPRFLQGAALPWLRLGDSRHERRAGHAPHGRALQEDSDHLQDDADRNHRHCRVPAAGRLLLQGRDPVADLVVRMAARSGRLWVVGYITAMMTAFYMFRLVWLTFFSKPRMDHETEHHIHESPKTMTVPLMILAVGSIFAGLLGVPHALGGSNRFEKFLEPVFANHAFMEHAAVSEHATAAAPAEHGATAAAPAGHGATEHSDIAVRDEHGAKAQHGAVPADASTSLAATAHPAEQHEEHASSTEYLLMGLSVLAASLVCLAPERRTARPAKDCSLPAQASLCPRCASRSTLLLACVLSHAAQQVLRR